MTVSIMLVTYNRLNLTQKTLNSLFNTTKYPFRIIIIDNGSTDGTKDWLNSFNYNCSTYCQSHDLQFNHENFGIATGRNQALKISNNYQDPWLSTIDNDIEFPDNWLIQCLDILSANPKFAVGLNFEDINYPIITRNNETFQYKKLGNLGTACTVFPRALHKAIGFFSNDYGSYGEEDADFFYRARLVGYEMGYLITRGIHLGQGEQDQGEYREFKNLCHQNNLSKFQKNCNAYSNRIKPVYISDEI